MTIRFCCPECESVLKIKDDMAGTKARCPKCKTPFVVPNTSAKPSPDQTASTEDPLEDLVDMPREITAVVKFDSPDEFDPMDALAGSQPAMTAIESPPEDEAPKPSVAELMREHEATLANKRKKREKKSKSTGGLEAAAGAASMMTAGTASDALNRNYDQKRGKASEPAPLTREERRQQEQQQAMKEFAIRGGASLAGLAVVLFFFMKWWFSASLPDLSYVSGVVTLNGQPLTNVEVTFSRQAPKDGTDTMKDASATSAGFTNAQGEYTLKYDAQQGIEGVLPGRHKVHIVNTGGISYVLPPQMKEQVVKEDESMTIDFKF